MKLNVFIFFALVVFATISVSAQSAAVRKEIRKQSCSDASITAVKIGPKKTGYVASCVRNAYEDVFLFENTKLILEAGGIIDFSKTTISGYYNLTVTGRSGCCTGIKTYHKWNGSRYVQSKCQEFDLERNGWRNPRPCS